LLVSSQPLLAAGCEITASNSLFCSQTDAKPIIRTKESHLIGGGGLIVNLTFEEPLSTALLAERTYGRHYDVYNRAGYIISSVDLSPVRHVQVLPAGQTKYSLVLGTSNPHPDLHWDWSTRSPRITVRGDAFASLLITADSPFTWSFEWEEQRRDAAIPYPEPASWMMMIFGFGAVGAALRRRKAAPRALPVARAQSV